MSAAKLVTIYGGSGFLGRQIARLLAAQGWRVRVAVRRPNEALAVRTYGVPGQIDPVLCNIRDDLSVRASMTDADVVVNCVGIAVREGKNTFNAIHIEGAERISRLAAELKTPRLIHVSALGADPEAASDYLASKGEGEAAVLRHRPDAVILRPSIIFGADDTFYNRIAAMTRLGPFLFVPTAASEVQPVYVMDVAEAAKRAAEGLVGPGIYELAGPDVLTMRDVAKQVLAETGRRRILLGLPHALSSLIGTAFDVGQTLTGGLLTNRVLTKDQARTLRLPNRQGDGTLGFEAFGIEPVSAAAIIPSYLWRFRPDGQFAAITDSAKNLRRN